MPVVSEGERKTGKRGRGWRVWAVVAVSTALLAALLVGLAALSLRPDPREQHAMRTPGALLAVTTGTEPLLLGAGWQKLALRIDPRLAPAIGGTILRCPGA